MSTYKVIADSSSVAQLSTDSASTSHGCACIANDGGAPVYVVRVASAPSLAATFLGGCLVEHGMHCKEFGGGRAPTVLSDLWIACAPAPLAAGASVAIGSYVAKPNNTTSTFVAAAFTQPAVSATVAVTVVDGSGFAVGDYVDRGTNAGLYVGGTFYDITDVTGNVITIRNRGLAGAVVSLLA
jgi:hypothetical protein